MPVVAQHRRRRAVEARNAHIARRDGRAPRQRPPAAPDRLEQRHRGMMRRRMLAIHRALLKRLKPLLVASRQDARRQDALQDQLFQILQVIEAVRRAVPSAFPINEGELVDRARQIDLFVTRQFERVTGIETAATDVKVARHLEWAAENARLISSIDDQYLDQVAAEVMKAVREGKRASELEAEIQQRYRVARSRAKLIARDQVGKLQGRINQERQREIGGTRYRWRNSQDQRVRGNPSGLYPNARPSHWHREGQIFAWDDPPEGGHPGEAIGCRCYPEMVFDDE